MKPIEIEINGKKEKIFAQAEKDGLWIHFQGETYFQQKTKPGKIAKKTDSTSIEDIIAPMPGKITKVLVKPGQDVVAKQTLVVMEAMKMEYNLRASSAAKIKKITCAEGEQVVQDQLLVEFEKL